MSSRIRSFPYLSSTLLGYLVARLCLSGLSGWGVAALFVAAVWFCHDLVRWLLPSLRPTASPGAPLPRRTEAHPDPLGEPLVSLVFFLSEASLADESSIRRCVSHALGIRFPVNDPDSDTFVMPFSPPDARKKEDHIRHFMVRIPAGLFAVLVSTRPYIENPKEFAKRSIRDKRLRHAVEQHVAWISVGLMDPAGDRDRNREAYQTIGKILAAMVGPDCLAIYCPELQRCNEFDPGLIEALCGDDPLGLFEEPTFEPVIEIADNHPKMAEAVREAVNRWPEFVAAYEVSNALLRERFIVKAEFREGRKSEFMWVSVRNIRIGEITGILMNDPHELLEVHRGARVTFSLDRLNDWLYPDHDGSHIGGFTLDVLADDDDK
jgi:uncharacterized protein YegJ (DUF2314 family)